MCNLAKEHIVNLLGPLSPVLHAIMLVQDNHDIQMALMPKA